MQFLHIIHAIHLVNYFSDRPTPIEVKLYDMSLDGMIGSDSQ